MSKAKESEDLKNFNNELQSFTSNIQKISKNARYAFEKEFLSSLAQNMHNLYEKSIEVQKMQSTEVKEIGSIIQNIFTQPLSTETSNKINIIEALRTFEDQVKEEPELSMIIKEYVKHPETTKSFIKELQILSLSLDIELKKIA